MSQPSLTKGYILAALIIVIWTGFILVARIGGTGSLTPYDVVAIRMTTALVIVLPLWRRFGHRPLLDPKMLALTLTGGLGYTLLTYSGFRLAPATHAAVLLSGFQPFAMTFCTWLVLREQPSAQRWLGIGIIACGATILGYSLLHGDAASLGGDALFLGASFCWALYTVLARRWQIGPWQITVTVAILASSVYLPVYLIALPKGIAQAGLGEIVLQMAYQGALAAVIQMVIYLRAVEILGPSRMGVLVALVPPLAATAAVFVLHEPITPAVIMSLALVSVGVVIGNARRLTVAPTLVPEVEKCPM